MEGFGEGDAVGQVREEGSEKGIGVRVVAKREAGPFEGVVTVDAFDGELVVPGRRWRKGEKLCLVDVETPVSNNFPVACEGL